MQKHYSLMHHGVEDEVLPTCEELGIDFSPPEPLMRGFLTDRFDEDTCLDPENLRVGVPSLQPSGLRANMALQGFTRECSDPKCATSAQPSLP